MKAKLG